jgi:uncharacterized membrane protein
MYLFGIFKNFSQKQFKLIMGKLDGIGADLQAAKTLVVKVKADVTSLHAKIDALPENPTQAEIDALKADSADLVASLQGVDDQTEDEEETTGGTEEGTGTGGGI